MAASNPKCFQKGCKCASCRWVCSRCVNSIPAVPSDGIECQGMPQCEDWLQLSWEDYCAGLGWTDATSSVTELDFIKATHGITGSEFDTLIQEGIIKPRGGGFEFDQMILYARLRTLRGYISSGVTLITAKKTYAKCTDLEEGKLCD